MIREVEGFDRYIIIAGFRNVKIRNVDHLINTIEDRIKDSSVQFFNAELIAGWQHLYFAALNALGAFESKKNVSNSLEIETLLFASAQRQIRKAVKLLGISSKSSRVAALIIAQTHQRAAEALETVSRLISGERDDGVVDLTYEKIEAVKRFFGISNLELESKLTIEGLEREALIDLVIEHVALLATQH